MEAPPDKVPTDQPKEEERGFQGGLPIDLERIMSDGRTVRDALASFVSRELEQEIINHEPRIRKLAIWNDQYAGIKPEKNWPWAGANNVAMPVTMYHTDAITVRLMDAIWGQKKVFICTGRMEPFVGEMAMKLENGLDWWQKEIVHLKTKLFSPILQAIKTGTGFIKLDYSRKKRLVYRYAKPEETQTQAPGLTKLPNGSYGIKQIITTYDGPDLFPISREDIIYSTGARTIQEALLFGFRFYKRKEELKAGVKSGQYDQKVVDKIPISDKIDETKIKRAESEGLTLDSWTKNLNELWELYVRFDVDEDGEEDDILITFHRQTKGILNAMYNPTFMGFRPFVRVVFNPTEYSLEGRGVCQILEELQEAIDFYHNSRMDRLDSINHPVYIIQKGIGIDEFTHAPGTKWLAETLDPSNAVTELMGHDLYPSTFQEESVLNTYAEKVAGVSPAVLGQSVSERPVARETIALLQEANKKFKFGIDNIRDALGEVGMMALELFAQYQPKYNYFVGTSGAMQSQTIDFPLEYLRDGVKVELAASSELMNTEVRQQIGLTAYQLLSDYYTKTAGMVQALLTPGLNPAFKQYLFMVMGVGGELLRGVLEDLGLRNAEALMPPLDKNPDLINAAVMSSMQPGALPPGQPGEPGSPPGGGPPQPGNGQPAQEGPPQ